MSQIDFIYEIDSQELRFLEKRKFKTIFKAVLSCFSKEEFKVELVLVTSGRIRALNKAHRAKDKPTDVLSFSYGDDAILGSIVIDIETAKRQARSYKQSTEKEIYELFIHGLLHLLGMDHESLPEADLMRTYERYFSDLLLKGI